MCPEGSASPELESLSVGGGGDGLPEEERAQLSLPGGPSGLTEELVQSPGDGS